MRQILRQCLNFNRVQVLEQDTTVILHCGTLSDVEIYTLNVHATNDAPVLTEVGPQTIDEDNTVVGLAVVYSDADVGDGHTVTVVSSESGVSVANLSGNASGRRVGTSRR